ncbi:MAG: DUF5668 domain-containing protein [Desulfotomaculaceae bacterium]|nr:DUF5668 domain-containing protein [Desulfotomaculaceae bacterium]
MQRAVARNVIGLIIIAFGVIALLNNFGLTRISLANIFHLLWPLLLIGAGITFILHRDLPGIITGAVLICLGVIFFGRNAGLFDLNITYYFWRAFWPVILILIGVNILFKGGHHTSGNLAIMGSVEKTKEVWELTSAEYTAVMGSIDLDVRKARFAEREVSLTLNAIMGGINVILPEDVAVTCKGTAILGGVEIMGKSSGGIWGNINTQSGDPQAASHIIHLDCTSIMGGIEIKK